MALWIVENTVFSGIGVLMIPVIVGGLAIRILLWAISFVRRNLYKVSAAL